MPASNALPAFHKSFNNFLIYLRDPELNGISISPVRFSEILNLDIQTLASQAHVHRNTISRAPTSEGVQHFLREAVRVIRAATDLSGDVEKALYWYRNEPLPVFGYKTAEQLVSDGRTEDLIRYIQSLEAGFAG